MDPEALLQRFFQLTVVMSDAMEEDLAHRGLSRARATLMIHLHREGPSIQRALAEALRVSPRNITGLVNALEACDLVKRSPHPSDRRAALVELTDSGACAAEALAEDEHELARYLFADRPTAELRSLAGGLDQLLARLDDRAFETLRQTARARWPVATTWSRRLPRGLTHGT